MYQPNQRVMTTGQGYVQPTGQPMGNTSPMLLQQQPLQQGINLRPEPYLMTAGGSSQASSQLFNQTQYTYQQQYVSGGGIVQPGGAMHPLDGYVQPLPQTMSQQNGIQLLPALNQQRSPTTAQGAGNMRPGPQKRPDGTLTASQDLEDLMASISHFDVSFDILEYVL